MQAAGRALEAGKPILAIKTGATAKSQAAAQSHTGAIGGDYAAYLAMCERYGIVNCRSLDDMVETALAFDGGRLPKGPRIGFVTTSGGTVDLLYDYAEAEGAVDARLSPRDAQAALMPFMQEGIEPKNPLDLGIPMGLKHAAGVCEVVAQRPERRHDRLGRDAAEQGRRLGRRRGAAGDGQGHRQADRRLRPHELPDDAGGASKRRQAAGFPFLQGLEPTLRALNALWFHAAAARQAAGRAAPCPAERPYRPRRSTRRSRATASRCRRAGRSRPRPKPRRRPRPSAFRSR